MKHGFTLIEIVVGLVLTSLLALLFFITIIPVTEALFLVRTNTEAAQKNQWAMTRLTSEFSAITNMVSGQTAEMIYDFRDPAGNDRQHTVSWGGAGQPLLLNGIPLSDNVNFFALRYYVTPNGTPSTTWDPNQRQVEILLRDQVGGITFSNRVAFRLF